MSTILPVAKQPANSLRAFEVSGILQHHRYQPIEADGWEVIPMVAFSLVGSAFARVLDKGGCVAYNELACYFSNREIMDLNNDEPNPLVNTAAVIGFISTFALCVYLNGPYQQHYEKKIERILQTYQTYQEMSDQDIAAILNHSTPKVRQKIVDRLNSSARIRVSTHVRQPKILHLLLTSPIHSFSEDDITPEERAFLDQQLLEEFWSHFSDENQHASYLAKFQVAFGHQHAFSILSKFLEDKMNPSNVASIQTFAQTHHLEVLVEVCKTFKN